MTGDRPVPASPRRWLVTRSEPGADGQPVLVSAELMTTAQLIEAAGRLARKDDDDLPRS